MPVAVQPCQTSDVMGSVLGLVGPMSNTMTG